MFVVLVRSSFWKYFMTVAAFIRQFCVDHIAMRHLHFLCHCGITLWLNLQAMRRRYRVQ